MRKKTYLQVEASRNRRLWITSVVMPIVTTGTMLYAGSPDVRNWVNDKIHSTAQSFSMKKTELTTRYEQWKSKKGS